MSYSFFYQAPNRTDDDTLIVDGEKLLPGTEERMAAFEALNALACEFPYPAPWSTQSLYLCKRHSRRGRYFAKGYFNEKDDLGRLCAFLFSSDLPADEALAKLIEVAKQEEFTLHPDAEREFSKGINQRKKKWLPLSLILVLVAIILGVICLIIRKI